MLGKLWTVAVAAAIAGALALPAPAAYAQGTTTAPAATTPATTKPAAMKPAAAKPMTMKKSAHKMDCYDYAWQSAAMNDCLAKKTSSGASKPVKKSAKKKKVAS